MVLLLRGILDAFVDLFRSRKEEVMKIRDWGGFVWPASRCWEAKKVRAPARQPQFLAECRLLMSSTRYLL